MRKSSPFRSWVLPLLLAGLSCLAMGQQGGAGGFRGGSQGNQGGQEEESFPPRNLNQFEWEAKSMILTQGDKVEWKIKGVPGQTLMATVRSDVFDPAIKIVDPKGKVVAENDDQYEGNQSPFIIFRFPDDKEYKLTVQNYRSSAGGRFMIYSQMFRPVDVAVGPNEIAYKAPKEGDDDAKQRRLFVHFKAEERKTYAIRGVQFRGNNNDFGLQYRQIIGPTGVYKTDFRPYATPGQNSPFFIAKTKGDFYAMYDAPAIDGKVLLSLDEVPILDIQPTGNTKIDLGPMGQKLLRFDVKRGDILHMTIDGPNATNIVFDAHEKKSEGTISINNGGFNTYELRRFDSRDRYYFFAQDGEVLGLATSNDRQPTSINLKSSSDLETWKPGEPLTGRVGLGETKFFLLQGKKGDIQRLSGSADGFELVYNLIQSDGGFQEYLDQRGHRPTTELRYEENRKYLVSVTSPMGGGSGSFSMNLEEAKPEPMELGKVFEYRLGPSLGTYALEVKAGVRYQILSGASQLGFTLLDENGDSIGTNQMDFGDRTANYFVPAKSGVIRVKASGSVGAKFRIDVHELPGLG